MNGMTPNKRLTHLRGPLRDAWWSPSSQRGQWRGLARDAVAASGVLQYKSSYSSTQDSLFPNSRSKLGESEYSSSAFMKSHDSGTWHLLSLNRRSAGRQMRYLALGCPLDVRGRKKTKGGFGGIRAEPSKKMIGILWAVGSLGRYYPQLLLKVPESKNTGNERVRRPPKPPVAYLNVRLNQSGEWATKQTIDSQASPDQPVLEYLSRYGTR